MDHHVYICYNSSINVLFLSAVEPSNIFSLWGDIAAMSFKMLQDISVNLPHSTNISPDSSFLCAHLTCSSHYASQHKFKLTDNVSMKYCTSLTN